MEKQLEKANRGSRRKWHVGILAAALVVSVSAAPNKTTAEKKSPSAASATVVEKKSPSAASANANPVTRLKSSLLEMPLAFELNQGQTDAKVKFLTRAQNFTVLLTPNETVLRGRSGDVLRMKLQNANQSPKVVGEKLQAKISNYYIGNDRSKWIEGVANFGQVRYRDVYSGVDLVYHSDQRRLEYDFVVKPGADLNQIRVGFEGASKIAITKEGELQLQSSTGTISVHHKPVVYQMIDGRRKLVQGEFTLAKNLVGFKIGEYDRTQPLVIDPTLQVLAFFGGTLNDEAAGIATSSLGTGAGVVFVGRSQSPALPGATKPSININWDAFATGLNAGTAGIPDSAGTTLLWTSYFGGLGDDAARGVVLDNQGFVYIAGYTNSSNFPGAASPASSYDAFVVRLSAASGGTPTTALYGGSGVDQGTSIALDYSTFSLRADATSITSPATDPRVVPNVVLGGFTTGRIGQPGSPTFSLAGGAGNSTTLTPDGNQPLFNTCTAGSDCGTSDGFVAIYTTSLTLRHATYIGGGGNDQVNGVAADNWGNIYATGFATPQVAPKFPIVNGIGVDQNGAPPLDAARASFGRQENERYAVAFVAKWACTTNAGNFPIGVPSPPPQIPACGGGNDLKTLSNSALFGGSGSAINPQQVVQGQQPISEAGLAIAVDQNGWGTHAVTSNKAIDREVEALGINPRDTSVDSGFPNIVPASDFSAVSSTGTTTNTIIVGPQSPIVQPCLPPGRNPTETNANLCVQTPGVGFTNQGGFQPGLTGPHVYVVGATANADFAESLRHPSCHTLPITTGGGPNVPRLCPTPVLNGGARRPADTLPNPAFGPAQITTVADGENSGQTQGWLVSFEFPAVTQDIITPPNGTPTLVTTLAPPTIPRFIVLQPPTCPGYDISGLTTNTRCVQGARPGNSGIQGNIVGAPPRCNFSGGGITCPDAFMGSWTGVTVDTEQQVYVIGQMGMSDNPNTIGAAAPVPVPNPATLGIGLPNRLALEMERIDPQGVPEVLFPDPVTAVSSSFIVDVIFAGGSNFAQILPGAPPSPDPNQPGGLGAGIAVNPTREMFFVGTTTALSPTLTANKNATITLAVAAGVVTIVTSNGGTGYTSSQVPAAGLLLPVSGTTGCTSTPNLAVQRSGGVLSFSFSPPPAGASNGGGSCTGAPTVTLPAAPAITNVSSNYLAWNPIEAPVLPTPATQFNLAGCLDPSKICAQNAATDSKTGSGPEDVIYGAVQFYDAIASPTVINFTAIVNQVASITSPDGSTGSVGTPPVPLAKAFINYTNWQAQPLNIPPGCVITPHQEVVNQPGGLGGYLPFVITQVGGTSQFQVTVNPFAVTVPGVVTRFITFDKDGPCTGTGQPPLDSWDPVLLTLTVVAPLDLSPTNTFVLTSKLASGLLSPYVENGFQLVANQTLVSNIGVTTADANGPINFTVQIVPGPNWTGPIQNAVTLALPTDTIYSAKGPKQTNIPVTVHADAIAGFPEGVYTAFIVFTPTPETPTLPTSNSTACGAATSPVGSGSVSPACIPIRITITGQPVSNVPVTVVFRNSSTPQQTSMVLFNPLSTGAAFNFTAGYVPNNFYCSPLPAQNVFFVGTGTTLIPALLGPPVTGTIAAGGQFTLPLQIDPTAVSPQYPTGLVTGCYSGMVLFANTNLPGSPVNNATPQTTVPVLVFVGPKAGEDAPSGNGLALMFPPNSPFPTGGIGGCPETNPPFIPCPPPGTQGTGASLGSYPLVINVPSGMGPHQLANPTMLIVTGLNNTATTTFLVNAPTVSASLPGVSITNPGRHFGTLPSNCLNGNLPGPGTYASFSSLPLSPLGPQCTWNIWVDSTAINASNTVNNLAACSQTGGVGVTGFLTFNPNPASFPFAPMQVPLTVCISDFPNLNVTQPVFYPNPTFGTGIPNPNFCGDPAFPVGCPQMIVGIPLPAQGLVLRAAAGNSTPACAEIGINTNGGGFRPLTGVQNVTIAPFTVPWLSTAVSTAPYLGVIPAFDSLDFNPGFTQGWGFDGGFGVEGGPGAIGAPIPIPLFYPNDDNSTTQTIPNNSFSTCFSGSPCSAVNTVAPFPAGPATVNNAMQTLQICANTDPLGNQSGSFSTTVTINGAGVGAVKFPVTFLVGGQINTPPSTSVNLAQLGVFRNTTSGPNTGLGQWWLAGSSNTFDAATKGPRWFGLNGDIAVAGDWTGNGQVRLGVFRCPAVGVCQWYIDLNNNGQWDGQFGGDAIWNFGLPGDQPVVGDWNGNGISKIGVMRCPAAGVCTWYLDIGNQHTYDPATVGTYLFGLTGDKAVTGPFASGVPGTPTDNIGVFRCPVAGVCTWFVDSIGQTGLSTVVPLAVATGATYSFGLPGDIPVVGNWNNNGAKRIGVFRNGQWLVDTNGNHAFDPGADQILNFGLSGDQPVVGFWTLP